MVLENWELQKEVRIHSINVNVTWTVQPSPLEIWVTVDGKTWRFFVIDPESVTNYYALIASNQTPTFQSLSTTDFGFYKNGMFDGRSVKIEAEITGGTVSNISAIVKWGKIP